MSIQKLNADADRGRVIDILIGPYTHSSLQEAGRQCVENAFDANATSVDIVVSPPRDLFLFCNDGPGFMQKDAEGFVMLLRSNKEGTQATGRWGSGRTFLFRLSEEVIVWSRSSDYPKGMKLILDRPTLQRCLDRDFKADVERDIEMPSFFPYKGKATGTVIQLKNVHWEKLQHNRGKKVETVEQRLVRGLSSYLNHEDARRVFVNKKPLEEPDALARIVLEQTHPKYGDIRVFLFIPRSSGSIPAEFSKVKIGGRNPLLDAQTYQRELDDEEAGMFPIEFANGTVFGSVNVWAFNKHRSHASHGEQALLPSFFGSEEQRWFSREFIPDVLCPEMDRVFGTVYKLKKETEAVQHLRDLVTTLGSVTLGGDEEATKKRRKKPPVVSDLLHVTPTPIIASPRQEIHLRITNAVDGREYVWGDAKSGGKCVPKNGAAVVYTAGKDEGRFELTVHEVGRPASQTLMNVTVTEDRTFTIAPNGQKIRRGDIGSFYLRGNRDPDKKIAWKLSTRSQEIRIVAPDGKSTADVHVQSLAALGDYEVYAFYEGEPETRVSASFQVVEGDDQVLLELDDQLYRVKTPNVVQNELVLLVQNYSPHPTEPGKRIGEITVQADHPQMQLIGALETKEAQRLGRGFLLVDSILIAHIKAEVERGRLGSTEWHSHFHELRGPLIEAIIKKKK